MVPAGTMSPGDQFWTNVFWQWGFLVDDMTGCGEGDLRRERGRTFEQFKVEDGKQIRAGQF
jgi:hypothetical protein